MRIDLNIEFFGKVREVLVKMGISVCLFRRRRFGSTNGIAGGLHIF